MKSKVMSVSYAFIPTSKLQKKTRGRDLANRVALNTVSSILPSGHGV